MRYNADGQKTVQSDASAVTTFTYDAAGRQVARQQAAAVASGSTPTAAAAPACPTASSPAVLCYGYDVAGNMTYASDTDTTNSKTQYSYNAANQVDGLKDQAGGITIFGYTADHQRADTWAGASGGNATFPPDLQRRGAAGPGRVRATHSRGLQQRQPADPSAEHPGVQRQHEGE
jgi:YD repeat-containing protein